MSQDLTDAGWDGSRDLRIDELTEEEVKLILEDFGEEEEASNNTASKKVTRRRGINGTTSPEEISVEVCIGDF